MLAFVVFITICSMAPIDGISAHPMLWRLHIVGTNKAQFIQEIDSRFLYVLEMILLNQVSSFVTIGPLAGFSTFLASHGGILEIQMNFTLNGSQSVKCYPLKK
ncbi:hypothetical protein SAY87_023022 [Trapa incisa]|uniref:Uncharacterized protein n=1 Tax=Trapa incisa TaxID=236973 RepID=A0AAN7K8D2_9MYRT|nr:hypothetical protein SAY87_023022 [Trapa incisa]